MVFEWGNGAVKPRIAQVVGVAIVTLAVSVSSAESPPRQQSATTEPAAGVRADIQRYCVSCHSDRLKTSGLSLEPVDLDSLSAASDVWERVVKKVRVGMMPPQGAPQPGVETRESIVKFLTTRLDRAATNHPSPGQKMIHRLNRAEYGNAVRDLLSLDVDASSLLPPDDSAYGFDNIADVLGSSPLLIEQYPQPARSVRSPSVIPISGRAARPSA